MVHFSSSQRFETIWSELSVCSNSRFCFSATVTVIIQLSAIHGKDEFNVYVLPEKNISPAASTVTQLMMARGRLHFKGMPVNAIELKEALQKFSDWLKSKRAPVVLFAHNKKSFDSKRKFYSLQKCDLLSSFQDYVAGFLDTLTLFKKVLPLRKKYSQESLVSDVLGMSYTAHDSIEVFRVRVRLSLD